MKGTVRTNVRTKWGVNIKMLNGHRSKSTLSPCPFTSFRVLNAIKTLNACCALTIGREPDALNVALQKLLKVSPYLPLKMGRRVLVIYLPAVELPVLVDDVEQERLILIDE